MKNDRPYQCQVLIDRLKKKNPGELIASPSALLALYPVRDPTSDQTIFDEVYAEVNLELLSKTYRFRFFYFLDCLLSSTNVPSYVVASFIKRLSRLTLSVKPRTLYVMIKLIGNLFMRHPILYFLRDRVDDVARELELKSSTCTLNDWIGLDPFDMNENMNLKVTKAMDSYIWEIMPLRFHENKKIKETVAAFLASSQSMEMEFDLTPDVV